MKLQNLNRLNLGIQISYFTFLILMVTLGFNTLDKSDYILILGYSILISILNYYKEATDIQSIQSANDLFKLIIDKSLVVKGENEDEPKQ